MLTKTKTKFQSVSWNLHVMIRYLNEIEFL